MTGILDEARKMLEGVPEGPWSAGVLGRTLHMVWAKDGYIVADCATHHAKHRENVARDFIIWSRTGVTALIERVAALERDVGILLANIRCLEEACGETLDGEDAEMVREIEREHDARAILAKGGSDAE